MGRRTGSSFVSQIFVGNEIRDVIMGFVESLRFQGLIYADDDLSVSDAHSCCDTGSGAARVDRREDALSCRLSRSHPFIVSVWGEDI